MYNEMYISGTRGQSTVSLKKWDEGTEHRPTRAPFPTTYKENIMTQQTIDRIRKFTEDRDWDQFHTPGNLAKSISIEANELLECFQWDEEHYDLQHVREELADVLVYCRNMLDRLGLDEDEIVNAKMEQNERKYPVEKARGRNDKYDKL